MMEEDMSYYVSSTQFFYKTSRNIYCCCTYMLDVVGFSMAKIVKGGIV